MASNKFNDTDVVLEEKKLTPEDKKQEEQDLPVYMDALELTNDQEARLIEELTCEFEALESERQDYNGKDMESEWDAQLSQYDNKTTDMYDSQFNIHMPTTKVKVDSIVRDLHQSYMDV